MSGHQDDAEAERAMRAVRLGFGNDPRSAATGPVTGDGVPFRILVLGSFGGDPARGIQGLSLRGEVPANMPEQLAAAARFTVPNLLGTTPDPIEAHIPVRRMSDFAAKSVAAAIELLRRAASLRAAVAGGLRSFENYADLDRLLAAIGPAPTPRAPAAPAPSEVDRLLSMLDLAGPADPPASATPPALPSGAGPKGAAATIDDLVARQLALVRANPRLEAMEAAWRGLRLLTGPGLPPSAEIDLVDVEPGHAPACLIRDIVPDELEGAGRTRLAAILVSGAVPGTEDGLNQLALCAAAGAALQVPVIVSLDQGFFESPDPLIQAGWQMLRSDGSAASLAACLGDIVLSAEGRDTPLWGEPGWAVAALALASFKQYGWPNELANPSAMTLDGLEVHEVATRGATAAWPLRRPLDRTDAAALASSGVLTLAAQANRDRLFLAAAPCLAPGTDLGAQMVAARLLAILRAAPPHAGPEAAAALDAALSGIGHVTALRAVDGRSFATVQLLQPPRTIAVTLDA